MPDEPEDNLEALPQGTLLRISTLLIASLFLVFTLIWLLSGGGAELFRGKVHIHAYMNDGAGLDRTSPVRLNGVKIGKVRKVAISGSLDPHRVVRVDMLVDRRSALNLASDSVAALTTDNLLGDKYINIKAGKSRQHVEDNAEIASLVQSGEFNPADLIASLRATLATVDAILTEINQGNSQLARFVRGEGFYDDLLSQVSNIQKAVSDYSNPQSKTGQLIVGDAFYERVRQPIVDIDQTLQQIQNGQGAAGRLLTESKDYDQWVEKLRGVHKSLADARSGKSPAGEFLASDRSYMQMQAALNSINRSIDNLTAGDTAFAELLRTSQLYDSLNGKSQSAAKFASDFRQEPEKFMRIQVRGGPKRKPHPQSQPHH